MLDLRGEAALRAAFDQILSACQAYNPAADIRGVLVTPMAGKGVEIIIGVSRDPIFGPVMMFGLGGIFVEILEDVAFRAIPLSRHAARSMVGQIRARRILEGARGEAPVDREALVDLLLKVSSIVAAYPQLAENPVHTFAPALAELTARTWDKGNEHFQPTSFQISNFNAGTGAPNVIPGELKARFNLRYSPVQTIDGLKSIVEGILKKHGVRYTLEWYVSGEPFYTTPGALSQGVTRAIQAETGIKPKFSTGGGTSDGRFIAPMGAQVVELGVINATIHKVNESVSVADIDRLHSIYLNALREMLT